MGDILLNNNNNIKNSISSNNLMDYDYLIKFLALGIARYILNKTIYILEIL